MDRGQRPAAVTMHITGRHLRKAPRELDLFGPLLKSELLRYILLGLLAAAALCVAAAALLKNS